jgi:hypothetical protein
MMPKTFILAINDAHSSGGLSFDLKDVLEVLGEELVNRARWCIFDVDATGPMADEVANRVRESNGELFLTGSELRRIAQGLDQTIDGEIVAYPPGTSSELLAEEDLELVAFPRNRMTLAIRAVDSSFFEVYVKDARLVDQLKARFKSVDDRDSASYFREA